MAERRLNLLDHYRRLWFYNWHRFQENNVAEMRSYFTHVLICELEQFVPLQGKAILDVGGARGEFCRTLYELRDMFAVNLDPVQANPQFWREAVRAYADKIPFPDATFDIAISRGVFEHIPPDRRQNSLNEMFRVTKSGGLGYIVIPPWFNPHAGHTFKPFHYFPFPVARYLRRVVKRRKTSERIRSYNDAGLYPLTLRGTLDLINHSGFKLLDTKDTHFRLHFLTRIWPLNELLVPAVAFILQKPPVSVR